MGSKRIFSSGTDLDCKMKLQKYCIGKDTLFPCPGDHVQLAFMKFAALLHCFKLPQPHAVLTCV